MRKKGFSLIEIIIVVVILGILAAVAIPKVLAPNERVRSTEGTQILSALLRVQKGYALENSGNYATELSALDITIPVLANFNAPTVANNASGVAAIQRSNSNYTLTITDAGVITCAPIGVNCNDIQCNKGGGGDQCN